MGRYDLEEKVKRQDYDLKELKERQRPELMMTEGSCMREAGMCSMLNILRRTGRRRWMNGLADLNPNFPNGLVRGQVRRQESQSHQMMKMKLLVMLLLMLVMMRRRKKRKRRKNKLSKCKISIYHK